MVARVVSRHCSVLIKAQVAYDYGDSYCGKMPWKVLTVKKPLWNEGAPPDVCVSTLALGSSFRTRQDKPTRSLKQLTIF